jgi:hypothetical protein
MATVDEIVNLINTSDLSIEDRVVILRALRNTIANLVAPEPRLRGRINAALAVRPEFIDSLITGLENSELWQQSSSTSPKELRIERDAAAEFRPLFEEAQAFADVLQATARYRYLLVVDKARTVIRIGRELTGDAAVRVKPHLDLIDDLRARRRSSSKPASTTPPAAKA